MKRTLKKKKEFAVYNINLIQQLNTQEKVEKKERNIYSSKLNIYSSNL